MREGATVSAEPVAEGVVAYEPETPFIMDGYGRVAGTAQASPEVPSSYQMESPFLSEYPTSGETELGAEAEAFAGLVGELEDEEFEEAVTDLVNEASALAETEFSQEAEPSRQRAVAESV